MATRRAHPGPARRPATWLLFIHRIPARPDYLRVRIGRMLRRLGALALKNSVYVLPATAESRAAAARVAREILGVGGEALVCEARFLEGPTDGVLEDRMRRDRDGRYSRIARRAGQLAAETARTRGDAAAWRRAGRELMRLRTKFEETVALDGYSAPGRESAAGSLALLEDRLQGVTEPAPPARAPDRASTRGATTPGATWVTRAGVKVDRIACAWLIRRFIDPLARFKFVSAPGYRARPDETRFDMAGAEHTHVGDRCTFEVLLERFDLRDPALQPIAEIVHDLDLEDGRYKRAETPGVGRLIVGLALTTARDEDRLVQGGAVFENLYLAFQRRRRRTRRNHT